MADFGGGTSDFSVVRIAAPGAARRCEPLGHAGVGIAGDRFDFRIVNHLVMPLLGKGGTYRSFDKLLEIPRGYFADFGDWSRLAREYWGRALDLATLPPRPAALFVGMVSSTIVSNALPTIVDDLEGSQTGYTWVVVATMLAMTATTPIWGKLSDLYGRKLMLQSSIVVFVIGSMLAAAGSHAVKWHGLVSKVIIPAALSPFVAALVATVGTVLVYRIASSMREVTAAR